MCLHIYEFFHTLILMTKYPFNSDMLALGKKFNEAGFSLYLVGGAVRDFLLKKENDDADFTTDATPDEVIKLFPKATIPTGIKHGTVTVIFNKQSYEITTFRTEGKYSDSRHPDNISFVRSLEEDLSRRDFTVNAFAASVKINEVSFDLNSDNSPLSLRFNAPSSGLIPIVSTRTNSYPLSFS